MSNLPVYQELLLKLETIKATIDRGFLVRLVGSPLSELYDLIADLIDLAVVSQRVNKDEVLNYGIRFEESDSITETEYLELPPALRIGYFLDPLTMLYQASQSDPLGNPLQITIPFEHKQYTRKDAHRIANTLEQVQQFIEFLSVGRIEFDFIRRLNRKHPISSRKTTKDKTRYFYRMRNSTKGFPKKKKRSK